MAQDLLARMHRLSRRFASHLGPVRPLAREAFQRLLRLRYGEGALMRANQNDRSWLLDPEVALRGEFAEVDTIRWFREVVREGMTVIDVGANVGQMTLELALLVGATGRVLAVEPAPGNVKLLRKHVRANGFGERVEIIEAACSDLEGEVQLFVVGESDEAVGSGHTVVGEDVLRRTHADLSVVKKPVAAVTVDSLCASRSVTPAVVKVDVEGAELHVLRGMQQTLLAARPVVRVGFHPFAFDDVERASDELRRVFAEASYTLLAPTRGALALEEYVARPN